MSEKEKIENNMHFTANALSQGVEKMTDRLKFQHELIVELHRVIYNYKNLISMWDSDLETIEKAEKYLGGK